MSKLLKALLFGAAALAMNVTACFRASSSF